MIEVKPKSSVGSNSRLDFSVYEHINKIFNESVPYTQMPASKAQQAAFDRIVQAFENENIPDIDQDTMLKLKNIAGETFLTEAVAMWQDPWAKNAIDYIVEHCNTLVIETNHDKDTPMHVAVRKGNNFAVQKLYLYSKIEAKNVEGKTPIHLAIDSEDLGLIDYFLNSRNIDSIDYDYTIDHQVFKLSLIQYAVVMGKQRSLEGLIKLGCSCTKHSHQGSLLHLAILARRYYMVRYLGTMFPDQIQARNARGETPFLLAARLGDRELLQQIHHDHPTVIEDVIDHQYPLAIAALSLREESIRYLLPFSSNVAFNQACDKLEAKAKEHEKSGLSQDQILCRQCKVMLNLMQNLRRMSPVKYDAACYFIARRKPENVVLRGGGIKGFAYIGAFEELERMGLFSGIKRYAGTSAGAITAGLLAIGYTPAELKEKLGGKNFTDFLDLKDLLDLKKKCYDAFSVKGVIRIFNGIHQALSEVAQNPAGYALKNVLNAFAGLNELWQTTGICKGEVFLNWFEECVMEKTGKKDLIFEEIRNNPGYKDIFIYATDVSDVRDPKVVCINSQDPKYDRVSLASAVRASMSIPGLFEPFRIDLDGKEYTFVDGGMVLNLGINTFDENRFVRPDCDETLARHLVHNDRTIGLSLFSASQVKPERELTTVLDLLKTVINTYSHAERIIYNLNPCNAARTIAIDVEDVSTLSFSINEKKRNMLLANGAQAVQNYFGALSGELVLPAQTLVASGSLSQAIGLPPQTYFLGREDQLAMLDELTKKDSASVLITGFPLSGKSSLAKEFAYRNRQNFDVIWWIDSSRAEGRINSYRLLADQLGVHIDRETSEQLISKVNGYLNACGKKWLLIFDGIYENISNLPVVNGMVIATASTSFTGRWTDKIELRSFSKAESNAIIQDKLKRSLENNDLDSIYQKSQGIPGVLSATLERMSSSCHDLATILKNSDGEHFLAFSNDGEESFETKARNKIKSLTRRQQQFLAWSAYFYDIPITFVDFWLKKHEPEAKADDLVVQLVKHSMVTKTSLGSIRQVGAYKQLNEDTLDPSVLADFCDWIWEDFERRGHWISQSRESWTHLDSALLLRLEYGYLCYRILENAAVSLEKIHAFFDSHEALKEISQMPLMIRLKRLSTGIDEKTMKDATQVRILLALSKIPIEIRVKVQCLIEGYHLAQTGSVDPDVSADLHFRLGCAFSEANQYEVSIKCFQRAIKHSENIAQEPRKEQPKKNVLPRLYFALGQSLVVCRRYKEANEAFIKAEQNDQYINMLAKVGRAKCCLNDKLYKEAKDLLQQAVMIQKEYQLILDNRQKVDFYNQRGMVLQSLNENKAAITDFDRALKLLDPKSDKDLVEKIEQNKACSSSQGILGFKIL